MVPNKTPLERAFELARSGRFENVSAIKTELSAEGYSVAQVTGPMLMRQIRDVLKAAVAE